MSVTGARSRTQSLLRDQRARYVIVGGWNTLFGLLVFSASYYLLRRYVGYPMILLLSQAIAVVQAHYAQRVLVWRSNGAFAPELVRFSLVYAFTYFLNLAALAALVEVLGLSVIPAQVVVTLGIVVLSYTINLRWTFR